MDYMREHKAIFREEGMARCVSLLKMATAGVSHAVEVPGRYAREMQIDRLQTAMKSALAAGFPVITLYDGLDEGWIPDPVATSIIGGLALAAADFTDAQVGILPMMFIRDNMFRALAHMDTDFTRHLEGHTLRLEWEETSLFHLVAQRLRVALGVVDVESDVKVWRIDSRIENFAT
jgi:hypothetical protein